MSPLFDAPPWLIGAGAEILAAREGMWTVVSSRRHTVYKVFPFSAGANELMIYGSVALGLKSGANVDVDWAARAELVKSAADGRWRMKYYQVYLVRIPLTTACQLFLPWC